MPAPTSLVTLWEALWAPQTANTVNTASPRLRRPSQARPGTPSFWPKALTMTTRAPSTSGRAHSRKGLSSSQT
ncbi:hypothetical protein D3C72_1371700 [compost metagenome]